MLKCLVALASVAALLASVPSTALAEDLGHAVEATRQTPDEFLATFDNAVLLGLGAVGTAPSITGNAEVDARIRAIGEARGYRPRPLPDRPLESVNGVLLQPEAAAGLRSLVAAAASAGHRIWATSGYRSPATQTSIFMGKLTGTSDAAIDRRLRTVAVPGYSKHHTGYAMDIRASDGRLFSFRNTAAYAWLAADNFANAKASGFVPSYPDGSGPAGPNPEPWEFVWVGAENILCGVFEATADRPFCDTAESSFAADIDWLLAEGITTGCRDGRFCTRATVTRAEAATFLWRLAGRPAAGVGLEFVDVPEGAFYSDAVRWMFADGVTTGTTRTTFEPDRPLTRAEFVTFLWRYSGSPVVEAGSSFGDVDPTGFAAAAIAWAAWTEVTTGTSKFTFSPSGAATRGQAAAFLHRLVTLD
jgi:D-alanyl-D-alanine carboxypeptidase-like protein/S-layer family protein